MKLTVIHPAIYITYYMILVLFAFIYNNPYYLITFLICIVALIILQGIGNELKTTLKFFVPMSVIIILLNPVVSHVGTTKIYIIGNYFITLEALTYGIIMSLSLLIILLTFTSYNKTVSYQEMLYIFSKRFPNISMVIIMALRFIPLFNYRLNEVNKISKFNEKQYSNTNKNSMVEKISKTANLLVVVVSWSLEESMITAKSMKARGYGIKERTSYLSYKFHKIDYMLTGFISFSLLICIIGLTQGFGRIEIYPTLMFSDSESTVNIYYLSLLFLLLPLIYLEIKEKLIWE
ncbi:MAG: energy-coupling factor transporter transmembrane protein EcfT [Methanobacterium sp. ERen5]|nr:MAG: energy-coupling factor transporter transmembrane protein EcfT [Methanobacterium sp. ERen5]